MTLRIESPEQLRELLDSRRADDLAPKNGKSSSSPKKQEKPKRGNVLTGAPWHVVLFRIFVGICAYCLLAVGWVIGAIGDSLYEVGKRMHEAKWNIR